MGRKKNKLTNFTKVQIFFGLLGGMLLLAGSIASIIGLCTGNIEALFWGAVIAAVGFCFTLLLTGDGCAPDGM